LIVRNWPLPLPFLPCTVCPPVSFGAETDLPMGAPMKWPKSE